MLILLFFFSYLKNLCQLSFNLTVWFYIFKQEKNIKR